MSNSQNNCYPTDDNDMYHYLIPFVEEACSNGDYNELSRLCKLSTHKFYYLEENCYPFKSKGHLMCTNFVLYCEHTDFVNTKYYSRLERDRNRAIREYMLAFKYFQIFKINIKKLKMKTLKIKHILKFGY